MQRFDSPDSYGALTSLCTIKDESSPRNVYSQEFQAMLDRLEEEDSLEEAIAAGAEKKRRLSLQQVQALEKNFEIENKLEPERKAKLAEELGLQPRQVAVWFQNRRARWKTKRLERDYSLLKSNYDALKLNFDVLEREKQALNAELRHLKGKVPGENAERDYSAKEQSPLFSESENNEESEQGKACESETPSFKRESRIESRPFAFKGFDDGPSDSDSSGILKEESGYMADGQLLVSPSPAASSSSSFGFNSSSAQFVSPFDWFQTSDCRGNGLVKMEEQCFYGATEDPCNFFSVDQAPTLHWYFPNQ